MRPLVVAASAYLLGCGAGALLPGASFPLAPLVVCWIAAAAAAASGRVRFARPGSALIFFAAGLLNAAGSATRLESGCAAVLADGASIRATATVEAMPDARRRAPLRVLELSLEPPPGGRARRLACGGTLRAKLTAGPLPRAGTTLRVTGRWWANPPSSVWPVEAERRGILLVARADRVVLDSARADAGPGLARLRGGVQARIRGLFGERAGLVEALVLARSEQIDPDVRARFVDAGLAHLLAISGTHVGLIAGALLLLLRTGRLRPNAAAWAAAVGTVAYVAFIGAPHAAARSAIQITLLIASRVLQRPADPYALLAAAALIVAGMDPLAPLEPGFQLSFAGILGIIAGRRPILARMPRALPRWLRDGLATGIAASAATMPIAALHFGQLALIGIPATLAAVPVLGAAVPGIGVALLAGTLSTSAGAFFAGGTGVLLDLLVRIADAAAAVPGGHGYVSRQAVLAALAAAGAAIIAIATVRERTEPRHGVRGPGPRDPIVRGPGTLDPDARYSGRVRALAAAGAAAAVLLAAPTLVRGFGAGRLEIHAINVGQGDAIAIRTPENRWILVDTGPRSDSYDAGRARVLPFLRDHGVSRVDLLVLTHPHADHIGGAAAVLDAVNVGVVVDPAIAFGGEQYAETLGAADADNLTWLAARAGHEVRLGDVLLEFLAPDTAFLDDLTDPNDYSAVFRLEFGAFMALFFGDAPAAVEDRIVRPDPGRFAARLVKVGHHGSSTSTGDSLLDTIRPSLALISVGRRNRYGHPDPGVLRRLHARGIPILRTDQRGNIRVRVDRDGRYDVSADR